MTEALHFPPLIKGTFVNYDAAIDTSPEKRDAFISWLTTDTITDLKNAQDDSPAIEAAIKTYIERATAAKFTNDEIEDILGVNEPSIMDLAELSDAGEEVVLDVFEAFLNR